MNEMPESTASPHLVWVYPILFSKQLDAATWLETTRELRNLGWKVTLIGGGHTGWQYPWGVEVFCISLPRIYLLRHLVFHLELLFWLMRRWGSIDFLLFHHLSAPWLLPLRLIRGVTGSQRPLLVMDTRTMPMEDPATGTFRDRVRGRFQRVVERLARYGVDGQTTITQRMAKVMPIPCEQLWGVWPSGANPDFLYPARTARQWPQASETVHLTYIGVLSRERNLMTLSRAVEKANAHGMKFELSLVGKGQARQDLEEYAWQTKGRVRVIPPISHDRIPDQLSLAHVGVLPFTDEEKYRVSSPIKLFEYMAAGLPILATRIACHTDVLGDRECVFWAEAADEDGLFHALQKVWDRRLLLSQMGQESFTVALSWTWKASAQKLSSALQRGSAGLSRRKGRNSI